MSLEIITKTKLICIPDDQVSFSEAAKEVLKIRKENPSCDIEMEWNGVFIPIKPRSTVLGCLNYYAARDEGEFPRKSTTHKVLR
jgi:hypothetical protein